MKSVGITEFKRLSASEILEISPILIMSDGEEVGYFVKKEDVIVIADMHPRVQNRFRGMEGVVRNGMPKNEYFKTAKEVVNATSTT